MSAVMKSELPRKCTISENDWSVLSGFWYPIAFSSEIGIKPVKAQLLDVRLVIYRTSSGISVAKDLCPHRGTSVSGGWIEDDQLICPYHGLHFGADGKCTRIPAAAPGTKISPKLCLQSYLVEERYGIIWTCLKPEPVNALPEWKEMEDPALQKCKMSTVWNVAPGRHLENFCDTTHFSWIHRNTFGDPDNPQCKKYEVKETDTGLFYHIDTIQQDGSAFGAHREFVEVPSDYIVTYPFNTQLRLYFKIGVENIFDAICPMSAETSRIFMLKTRDHDMDLPTDEWADFQATVNEEDRQFVEDQHPEELPIDLTQEFHIPSDVFSIAYRRKWKAYGLEGPIGA